MSQKSLFLPRWLVRFPYKRFTCVSQKSLFDDDDFDYDDNDNDDYDDDG